MNLVIRKQGNQWFARQQHVEGEAAFDNAEQMCDFAVVHMGTTDDELDKAILYMAASQHNTAFFTATGMFESTRDT